jgi:hypothetical protein
MKNTNKLESIFLANYSKPFYWTIDRRRIIENETQAIEEVQRLWKIILAQCDS